MLAQAQCKRPRSAATHAAVVEHDHVELLMDRRGILEHRALVRLCAGDDYHRRTDGIGVRRGRDVPTGDGDSVGGNNFIAGVSALAVAVPVERPVGGCLLPPVERRVVALVVIDGFVGPAERRRRAAIGVDATLNPSPRTVGADIQREGRDRDQDEGDARRQQPAPRSRCGPPSLTQEGQGLPARNEHTACDETNTRENRHEGDREGHADHEQLSVQANFAHGQNERTPTRAASQASATRDARPAITPPIAPTSNHGTTVHSG